MRIWGQTLLLTLTKTERISTNFYADRVTRIKYSSGKELDYTYYARGLVHTATKNWGPAGFAPEQETYSYDADGRLTTTHSSLINEPDHTYVYYPSGRRQEYSIGSDYDIKYVYDALGRVSSITDKDNEQFSYTYDAAGNMLNLAYPNGTHISYVPDANVNRIAEIKYLNSNVSGHDVLLDDVSYSYDNMSNVTGVQCLTGNKEYIYDIMNRLTTVNNKNKAGDTLLEYTGYSYNGTGYRSGVDNNGATQDTYNYSNSDQLLAIGAKTLSYDQRGNETSDGTNNYLHDDMNMLTQVMIGGTNGSILYSYDLENRLKTRRNTNTGSLDVYYYDGRDIVMEKDAAGNINSLYVRGPGGEMLKEKRRYTNTSGSFTTKYYYYPDRIGSVYIICDDHGMLLEKENADAFGNSKTVGISKYGLTSNMYDTDTGLYYFHARWYDGKTGRFLEMDPVISDRGLMNMYEFPNCNPVTFTDRYGEGLFNDLFGVTWNEFVDYGVEKKEPSEVYSEGKDKSASENKSSDTALDLGLNAASGSAGAANAAFNTLRSTGAKMSAAIAGAAKNARMAGGGLVLVSLVISGADLASRYSEIDKMDVSEQRKKYLKEKANWEVAGSTALGYAGGALATGASTPIVGPGDFIVGAVVGTGTSYVGGFLSGLAYDISH
jgi:RHS repeat-associated protein